MSYDYYLDKCVQSSVRLQNLKKEDCSPLEKLNLLRLYNTFLTKNDAKDYYLSMVETSINNDLEQYFKENKQGFESSFREVMNLLEGFEIQNRAKLPKLSVLFEIKFKLLKPYISRDDESLYVTDNPIKKDKLFKLPYIPSTTWKGNLRSVARQQLDNKDCLNNEDSERDKKNQIIQLFGSDNETEIYVKSNPEISFESINNPSTKRKGRLVIFPTYFRNISVEIINPHDKEKGSGENPILIEAVPAKSKGILKLFYFPYDLIHQCENQYPKECIDAMISDIKLLKNAILGTLFEYGFGAKKTSGYGTADESSLKIDYCFQSTTNHHYEQIKGFNQCFEDLENFIEKYRFNHG